MGRGRRWAREELLVAMNLYCQLPFGKLHHRNKLIIEVAEKLSRTAGSVAMKLCNLASLDPVQRERGVKGLTSVSRADREIWDEFHSDWSRLALESQRLLDGLLLEERGAPEPLAVDEESVLQQIDSGRATAKEAFSVQRRGQGFFRRAVLASYDGRCCITGNPIPELLRASHILPWSKFPEHRLNPRNGLCLAATHDAAFDRGLLSFDGENRLVLSSYLEGSMSERSVEAEFLPYRGKPLRLPDKFAPDPKLLAAHRSDIFRG